MWKTIRKFGLHYCDFPTMIWNVAVMLRVLAVKVEKDANPIPIFIYILNIGFAACYFYVYPISTIWFAFERAHDDVVLLIKVVSPTISGLVVVTKLIYLYMYQAKVQDMVAGYKLYDSMLVSPRTIGLIQDTMRTVKIRAIIFWSITNGNGFVYHLKPLFMSGRHFSSDDQIIFGLEPVFETPNYQIAEFCIVTAGTLITFVVSNISCLLIICAGYSEARALGLGQELSHLWQDALQYYKETFDRNFKDDREDRTASLEINKYLYQRLRMISKSHAINIKLVNSLENIFREAIAVQILVISLAIVTYLLVDLRNTYLLLPFPLIQVSMDCFTGQRLMDASKVLEDAVYNCKWENFDVSNRKMIVLMLKMAQKKLTLSAGGVAALGFAFLMSMLSKIYSAYTTLQSSVK